MSIFHVYLFLLFSAFYGGLLQIFLSALVLLNPLRCTWEVAEIQFLKVVGMNAFVSIWIYEKCPFILYIFEPSF